MMSKFIIVSMVLIGLFIVTIEAKSSSYMIDVCVHNNAGKVIEKLTCQMKTTCKKTINGLGLLQIGNSEPLSKNSRS